MLGDRSGLYQLQHIILDVYIQLQAKILTSLVVAVSAKFFRHTISLGNFEFWAENQGQFFLDFFSRNLYQVVLVIPSVTFRPIRAPDHRQKRVASWPRHLYFVTLHFQASQATGAGHIGLNILYWTCTFNYRPKFERRSSSPFRPNFFAILYPEEFWIFYQKSRLIFCGFFSRNLYQVVLVISSVTFRPIRTPDHRQKRVASWPRHLYFVTLHFQASQATGAGHIGLKILYWTCTFNFRPKFERRSPSPFRPNFFAILYPQEIFDFWPNVEVNYFWIFFQKSVLGSPGNSLSNFQAHPNAGSQVETGGKLASTPLFCYPSFSGMLGDRSRPYQLQHIILDVYIQFQAKI